MTASTVDLLQEAARLHRQGALADAASRYRQVLESEPDHAAALYHLAVIACQQGRFAEGIELARRSLASDPQQPRAHNLLGMALSRLGAARGRARELRARDRARSRISPTPTATGRAH